jgi:hypothetical protein
VVRGPAALLIVLGASIGYFTAAPSFPQIHPPELSAVVACTVGLTFVCAIVGSVAALADAPLALVPAVVGAGLLVAVLDAAGAASSATPFEAVLYGCAGVAFAVALETPLLALGLPLFVGAIDVAVTLAGGGSGIFTLATPHGGDALALDLPDWGTGLSAARLSPPDVLFFGVFLAYARRLALRERAAAVCMYAALLAAALAQILFDAVVPALALLCAGFLVPNVDRLQRAVRAHQGGVT